MFLNKILQKNLWYYKSLSQKELYIFLIKHELNMKILIFCGRDFHNILHNLVKKYKCYTWIDLKIKIKSDDWNF